MITVIFTDHHSDDEDTQYLYDPGAALHLSREEARGIAKLVMAGGVDGITMWDDMTYVVIPAFAKEVHNGRKEAPKDRRCPEEVLWDQGG